MDNLVDIIGKIVIALGGAGTVIIALSSYISKLWADNLMKKKTAEYDKQFAIYKLSIDLEIEKMKALNEQVIYKNKQLFDKEFKIYEVVIPKLIVATDNLLGWLVGSKLDDEKYSEYINSFDDLRKEIARNVLFMDKEIHAAIEEYSKYIHSFVIEIVVMNLDKYVRYKENTIYEVMDIFNELSDMADDIRIHKEKVIDKIRTHLKQKSEI